MPARDRPRPGHTGPRRLHPGAAARVPPGPDDGQEVTNQTERITNLWVGSWSVLILVGLIIWGLTIWCAVAYRRRKNDKGFPIQLRYHVPLELMFTLVPVVMVLTLFYFTQRDTREVEMHVAEPDVTVNVVAKQWSWDFNYVDDNVHEPAGVRSFATGEPGAESLPVLWVPVDQTVSSASTRATSSTRSGSWTSCTRRT